MTDKTLTWDEAFDDGANAILEELCNEVADAYGQVALANYRQRLGLHVRPGVRFDAEAADPILRKLSADVLGAGVDLNAYRVWLATATATAPAVEVPLASGVVGVMDFTDIGLFGGKLALHKVWIDYEGPKLFALYSPQFDLYYIVNAIDEDDEQGNWLRFLAVPVNPTLFATIDAGLLPLRDAFEQPNEQYTIMWRWTGAGWYAEVGSLRAADVPDAWLPMAGATFRAKVVS